MDIQCFVAKAERKNDIFDLGFFDNKADAFHAAKEYRRHLTDSEQKVTETWVYSYFVPDDIETLDEFTDYMEENQIEPCDCKRIFTSPELRSMVEGKDYGDPNTVDIMSVLKNEFKHLSGYQYDVLYGAVFNAWVENNK